MNVNEVLQFVDRLVLEKTGKHLDDVQKAVVEGSWHRLNYDDIAKKCHVTQGHVGDVGAELWQLLSEALDENIKKTNFRSTLERLDISLSQSSQNICNIGNSHCSFGSQVLYNSKQDNQEKSTDTESKLIYHDLTLAPKIINFYNRESELKTLINWILSQNTRLISVLGLSGIGKTILVKRFVDLNLDQFEIVVWKRLDFPKSLELLVNDLLNICQQNPKENLDDKLKQLFDIFIDKRCLIIFDNVQNIFVNGELAGHYQTEYKDYQNFFSMIIESEHQSNVILISQEQCAEMECLDEELYPVRCLELSGLRDIQTLNNTGLEDEDSWLDLINLYEGNPFYLKNISMLINKNYDGKVADFLAENTLHITDKIQIDFTRIFNHLSSIEQIIVLQLSKFEQPVSREDLRQLLSLPSVDFNNGLQSLQQRYLVTKIKVEKILFKLFPLFREYVRNYC